MKGKHSIFLFLSLIAYVFGTTGGKRLVGSLKWLENQNSDREFLPDRDSIQVPVAIVTGHATDAMTQKKVIDANHSESESPISFLSKMRHSLPHSYLQFLQNNNSAKFSTRPRSKSICAEDIPEWNIYHRVYNGTGKCYIPSKGENPCPENMQFYLIEGNSNYGECDCKIYVGSNYRPLVYWAPSNKCFHLFDKGPCASGEWLTLNSIESNSICEKSICPESVDKYKSWFLLNSTCYQLNTRAFCTNENQTVHYGLDDFEPKCFDKPVKAKRTLLNGALTLPCKRGHKAYKHHRSCQT